MRTLVWDLETFGFDFKADKGFILCGCIKDLEKPTIITLRKSARTQMWDDKEVCKKLYEELIKGDRWVTHNGKRFDVRFLNVRLVKNGLPLLPPMGKRHIDTCELTWKNMAMRASLKNIQEFFELKNKKTPVNIQTWTKAASGDQTALDQVVSHCKADVKMLEEYYLKISPLVTMTENPLFHICDKKFLRSKGYRVADKKVFKRLFCLKCGGYFKGEVEAL